ncbi:MAG: malto-oligosyltrehalose trehalohydrolase [Cytophagaceae bacterium]|jgi:maltooligosyltrehalose trehalohydrolase|nr:malto-oligosyltrehalose trehalohydrolase [Cytophagaceae bacterium]
MNTKLGAQFRLNQPCEFKVWAPESEEVKLILSGYEEPIEMSKDEFGYWSVSVDGVKAGDLYMYKLDREKPIPDPASLHQPDGVHGASQVIDQEAFLWSDKDWSNIPMEDLIIYELHVGTFTPQGTFDAVIQKLDYLVDLGINAIELMPISQFPGDRNWGYDIASPFAIQNSYGGPDGLKRLVNACHLKGLAIIIDAVYNHLGPEGNYMISCGPYHTDKYNTPWGCAINFDDAHSDEVRNYYIQNALLFFKDYHVDALRLDAVHAYKDEGAIHFVQELSIAVKELSTQLNKPLLLIGECDLNDPRYISPVDQKGMGLDAQWCDEFHHALHALITGETTGYYADFGDLEHMRRALAQAYVYTGHYSKHRKKTFGKFPQENHHHQFVVFSQNHDQIGNRLLGERLSKLVSFERLKLSAALVLLSPAIPLLFMGEEFGEENPFLFFIDHSDPVLKENVKEGRKKEFAYFFAGKEAPDPAAIEVYDQSKLNWSLLNKPDKKALFNYYKRLIAIRKKSISGAKHPIGSVKVQMNEFQNIITLEQLSPLKDHTLYLIINFGDANVAHVMENERQWKLSLNSASTEWGGDISLTEKIVTQGNLLYVAPESVIVLESV